MASFSHDIAVTPAGEGVFTAMVSEDWSQGRAAFGGLLTGQMLRAAESLLPPMVARSVVVDFLAPARPGGVSLEVRLLRAGRSMSRVEIRLSQGETRCATMLAAFGPARQTAICHDPVAAPPLPEDAVLIPMPLDDDTIPRFTRQLDYRYRDGRLPFTAQETPGVGGLVRFREPTPLDAAAILALIDAWPSPALPILSAPAAASTVTWMVNFTGRPVAAAPTDWWRFEADLIASSGGFSDTEGRLWGPDGALVATSRQLVAEFSRPLSVR